MRYRRRVKSPKVIVIGIDFSDLSDLAVETGFKLADRFRAERVHLLHINDQSITADIVGKVGDDWRRKMAVEKLETIKDPDLPITREVRDGIPSRDIAAAAKDVNADLIVVATQGLGIIRRALIGSVTSSLIRTAECPVLVVAEHRKDLEFHTVVAGVVPAPIAREVVEHAMVFAGRDGEVEIVSSLERPTTSNESIASVPTPSEYESWKRGRVKDLEALIPKMESKPKVIIEVVEESPPSNVILDHAKKRRADLIVIGTSGRNFWHRMVVGSTATHVVDDARCPVLVVPPAQT